MKKILSLFLGLLLLVSMVMPVAVSAATPTASAALWQLDVDNTVDDGGMSYVIRCTDGKFIVIDGGYETEKEADNLYKVLTDNNVGSGKPVIAAWYFSHVHADHIGGFLAFTEKYDSEDVTIENFYFNFPTRRDIAAIPDSLGRSVREAAALWTGATVNDAIERGNTFTYSGVSVDVLLTWKDVSNAYYTGENSSSQKVNDTSTVFRVTIGGQTIIFLGDAYQGVSAALENTYTNSELKSDMVQVAHHGFDDGSPASLYEKIDADVAIWPMDIIREKDSIEAGRDGDSKTFVDYYNNGHGQSALYGMVSDVYPAYENTELAFPYTVQNNKPAENSYWSTLAKSIATEKIDAIIDGDDITWYDASKSTYELYDVADFLGLDALAQSGVKFAGKTIKLMADIDLNPGWDASTTVAADGTVTLASAPTTKWLPIPEFRGTLDGNGHTIKGIYSETDFRMPSEPEYFGGFINVLSNRGKIKNLRIENSLAHFYSSTAAFGTASIRIGGFIGRVVDSSLETLYIDMDAWNEFSYHYTMGGMLCEVDTDMNNGRYGGVIKNIVYAGTSGRICSDGKWNTAEGTSRIYAAGMIAQNHNAKNEEHFCYVTMENMSFIGTAYRPLSGNGETTFDALLAYTGGTNYSSGIAANNTTAYYYGANTNGQTTPEAYADSVEIGDVAIDFKSNGGSPTSTDTYTEADWAAVTFTNGANASEILLPRAVTELLGLTVKVEHTHSFTENKSDATHHWTKCEGCDEIEGKTAHSGGTATCTAKAVCATCGENYGDFASHSGGTATCTAKAKCSACNTEYGTVAEHDFSVSQSDADNHWNKCATCDAIDTKAAHTGGTATCTAKAKCSVCNTEYGTMAAHDFRVLDNDADNHWNKCASCDATDTKQAHTFGDDNKCTACDFEKTVTSNNDSPANNETNNTNETDDTSAAGGCSSSLGGVMSVVIVCGLAVAFVGKKKKEM